MSITPDLSSTILWITGDEDVMRHVFREHGFGYWTACFDILLEKHGLLCFEKASQDALERIENLAPYDFLIISWLPKAFWKPQYLETVRNFHGPVFMEGPFPQKVAEYLGLKLQQQTRSVLEAELVFSSAEMCAQLRNNFTQTIKGRHFIRSEDMSLTSLNLSPKQVFTKEMEPARQELAFSEEHPLEKRLHDIALSYLLAYKNRFHKNGLFFQDSKLNGLAFLVWLEALGKFNPGDRKRRYEKLVREGLNASPIPDKIESSGDVETVAVFGCALATGARVLDEAAFAEKSRFLLEYLIKSLKSRRRVPAVTRSWTLALAAAQGKEALSPLAQKFVNRETQRLQSFLKTPDDSPIPILLWTLAYTYRHLHISLPSLSNALRVAFTRTMEHTYVRHGQFGAMLEGRHLWEVLLIAGAAALAGLRKDALKLLELCMEQAFDSGKGFFLRSKVRDGRFVRKSGYQSGPWAALGILSSVEALHIRDLSETTLNYTAEQVSAWERPPYYIRPYIANGCDMLASFNINGEKHPGFFQNGRIFGSTFQLLSYLVHYHTLHPVSEALLDCPSSHVLLLESLVFSLLDREAARREVTLLKVAPWPWGKKYCFTIRHDVDRIPDEETFRRLLSFEKEQGLGVSWYWIPGRIDESLLRCVEEAGHEVGLHAMRLDRKPEEKKEIESRLANRGRVYGENWHGGGGGDYWIGQPSVKAAIEAGMHYTELMPTIYDYPYSAFPALDQEGRVYCDQIVGLTHTCSVDAGTRKGIGIYKLDWMLELARCGYYCMLLNHPDANFKMFRSWIETLPEEGRLDWTCAEVAEWWKATHQRERLAISKVLSEAERLAFVLISKDKVEDLELRLPLKDRCISSVEIDSAGVSEPTSWGYGINSQVPELRLKVSLSPKTPKRIIVRKHPLP